MKVDLLKKYCNGKIKIREKNDNPSIGFVGMADYPKIKLVLLIIKQSLKYFKYFFKIQYLNQNQSFLTSFIEKHIWKQLKDYQE